MTNAAWVGLEFSDEGIAVVMILIVVGGEYGCEDIGGDGGDGGDEIMSL